MTYGDFAWKDLLGSDRRRERRGDRTPSKFVDGEPVPWMGAGEGAWSWAVKRQLPQPYNRPFLTFAPSNLRSPGRRALDDFCKPVFDMMRNDPVSLWAKFVASDRPGLKIAESAPGFPPTIDRTFFAQHEFGHLEPRDLSEALAGGSPLLGREPVGVHLTVPRLRRADVDFGGVVRVVFDGLSTTLGGDMSSPADKRIWDLRVVRDSRIETVEIRLWLIRD